MPMSQAVKDLLDWKKKYLQDQIDAINAHIDRNNGEKARLQRLKDTGSQVDAIDINTEGLEIEKKDLQDELDRFNAGSDGKKYNMSMRNIGNLIGRIQNKIVEDHAQIAVTLNELRRLTEIEKKAHESMLQD